ncbi:DNA polymerase III subunit gamma/tau [Pararhizobium haloflavum]|uniref:DNA polymerase III subunit gamma/tau n=1 Tax=Pararhizobium haloflavum TaxID=2037914 RepID=UPI000C199843|nr:DNA polymerase III subunit gamma/tau [Pararhizobium haloflavum]
MADMERSMWDEASPPDGQPAEYRVLARKYRPKDFTDLIGQEPMVRTLTNAFRTGRIAQAYMLTGVRGVGKTTTARILARALNYRTDTVDEPSIDLARSGDHCKAIIEGRHVDVIEMDAASHTGIDDIREIIEQVRYRPVSARYKVYIIDEVHMLSTQAFNGLLKTLEEPPPHVKFIFATTEIRKVPITVLSRCQRFDLRRIDAGLLVEHFRRIADAEKVEADDLALSMIARAAEGSVRDGLSLMDQAIAHGGGRIEADAVRSMLGLADRGRVIDLFAHIAGGDVAAALAEFRDQYDSGANPPVVLTDLADFTHLVTRLKFVPQAANDPSLSEAERSRGGELAGKLGVPVLSRLWQMLLKGISETEGSNRPYSSAEMVLIRLTHAAHLPSPEDAARQVQALADGGQGVAVPGAPSGSPAGSSMSTSVASAPRSEPAPPASQPPPHRPAQASSQRMQLVAQPAPEPEAVAVPHPEAPSPVVSMTIDDIVDLATENRDIKLKTLVRTCVRPVSIEAGRLEVSLTDEAPKSLLGDLGVALEKWTGQRWMVTLSRETGAPTVAEAEAAERDTRVRSAREDPDVAAILERFPGARITDVRITAEEAPDEMLQSEEGDVLPAGDQENETEGE